MRQKKRLFLPLILVSALLTGCGGSSSNNRIPIPAFVGDGKYTQTRLGVIGNVYNYPAGMNSAGEVAGSAVDSHSGRNVAAAFTDDSWHVLGAFGKSGAQASGINDAGTIVGVAYELQGNSTLQNAFVYASGKTTYLTPIQVSGTDSGSIWATAINNSGQITGVSEAGKNSNQWHAYLYSNGITNDLGTLGGRSSYGYAINDRGQVTGTAELPLSVPEGITGYPHAFLYTNGAMTDIGVLDSYTDSKGRGINENGDVVGECDRSDKLPLAFLYTNGKMASLGTLGTSTSHDEWSIAYDINNHGQIIGDSDGHGFLYQNGKMIDLNTLIRNPGKLIIFSARAINDRGEISAMAGTATGPSTYNSPIYAVLLTP